MTLSMHKLGEVSIDYDIISRNHSSQCNFYILDIYSQYKTSSFFAISMCEDPTSNLELISTTFVFSLR